MNLINALRTCLLTACLSTSAAGFASTGPESLTADPDSWKFRVYLNDKEIGYHHFYRTQQGDTEQIDITAEFKVKFLFVTAFSYRHDNTEVWQDSCLASIDSRTLTNGDEESVSGTLEASGLRIETADVATRASGCVRTFAYWDRDLLSAPQLLNSQTGRLVPVEVETLNPRSIPYRGDEIEALPYRLTGGDLDLEVFYVGDRWVGLESTVEGGRKLRYELI
ncbi:MAG: DUF6134 family protein [Pseudomonadota bacterium]